MFLFGLSVARQDNRGLCAQTLENSVRQFAITFLGLIGSNPQFEGAFRRLFQCQVCRHRIEIDRNSFATKVHSVFAIF